MNTVTSLNPRRNRAEVERVFRVWQQRLKLQHWRLGIDWAHPHPADETDGEMNIVEQYDLATLRLSEAWMDWPNHYLNVVLVHELLHLHSRAQDDATKSLKDQHAPPLWEIFWGRYCYENERLVDRLAYIIVELAGEA